MKKLLLLTLAGGLGFSATAQQVESRRAQTPEIPADHIQMLPYAEGTAPNAQMPTGGAEGILTPFYIETFGSGTNTTMPTNWTTTGNSNFATSWKWRRVPTTSSFSAGLGALNSPTGGAATASTNDGWMIYDSDSIGSINTALLPIEGYLTSPIISCSGHSTVQIAFYQWFRRFRDSCFVDVSNNGGGTWTRFGVEPNNTGIPITNANLPSNPTFSRINISSVAANQANVRIRFYYKLDVNTGAGGAFAWLVDDVTLSELDPVDLSLDNGEFVMALNNTRDNFTSFGQYPRQLVDTVFPIGFLTNYGASAQPTASVNARILRGTTQVFNQSVVYNTPSGNPNYALDSLIDFTTITAGGYLPTDTGAYTIAFSVNATGDVLANNNNDTVSFRITDSLLSMNVGASTGSWSIQTPATSTAALLHRQVGAWFEISEGMSDTLSAVSAVFANTTTVGSIVQAQIYKQVGTGTSATWQFRGETLPKTLAAADISTASSLVATRMGMDFTNGFTDLILDEGFYACVVRGQGNPPANTIAISATQSPAWITLTSFGTLDTSDNQAFSYTYGAAGNPPVFNLGNSVPYARPHFGRVTIPNAINNVSIATVGAAYPNPANTKVTIPVSLSQASEVSVLLSNAQGQVLARQELGRQASGRGFEISFPTGALANGVYFYTVEAAGEKKTGRIVVAH